MGKAGRPSAPSQKKVRLLSLVDVFQPLSREQIEELRRQLPDVRLRKDEIFYAPGDANEKLFILRSGLVRMYKMVVGRELTLAMVEPGTVFGEMALTAQRLHGAYAQAVEPCEISVMTNADLRELILKHPEVGLRMVDLLGERLSVQESRMADIALKDVRARLASLVLRLVGSEGVMTDGGRIRIPTLYTHQQLGSMIGANREAVTNAFAGLQVDGGVELIRRRIYITDVEALRREAI
jgi:CRP-like cAMP-binding protein